MANCHQGVGAGTSGTSGTAYPQPPGTMVAVPVNSAPVSYSFSIDGLSASVLQQVIAKLPACIFPMDTGLQAQVAGGYNDPMSGLTGLTFHMSADPSSGPALIQDETCQITIPLGPTISIVFRVIATYSPSCSPSISSLQVNFQNTNSIIDGTAGNIAINGTCLLSTASVTTDTPGIYIIPPNQGGYSDTSMTVGYQATACPSQGACATTGQHNLTVAAQVAPGQPQKSASDPLTGIHLAIRSVTWGLFGGNVTYHKDCPANTVLDQPGSFKSPI